MSLPQSNATITAVHGPGTTADWDQDATDGTEKFAGQVDAYYSEQRERSAEGPVIVRRSVILRNDAVDFAFDKGDTVTLTAPGFPTDTLTGTVDAVERRSIAAPYVAPEAQTTRLTLRET